MDPPRLADGQRVNHHRQAAGDRGRGRRGRYHLTDEINSGLRRSRVIPQPLFARSMARGPLDHRANSAIRPLISGDLASLRRTLPKFFARCHCAGTIPRTDATEHRRRQPLFFSSSDSLRFDVAAPLSSPLDPVKVTLGGEPGGPCSRRSEGSCCQAELRQAEFASHKANVVSKTPRRIHLVVSVA